MMEEEKINQIVELVLRQLQEEGLVPGGLKNQPGQPTFPQETLTTGAATVFHPGAALSTHAEIEIDLPDPAGDNLRWLPRVKNAKDPGALIELMASTSAASA